MIDQVPHRQMWVAPKLTVFGDVNALTKVPKYANPGDGIVLGGISIGPTPGFPGQPSVGHVSI
jgi:hypothetical protein